MLVMTLMSVFRLRLAESSLIISSAQQADEGRYQCIARNIAGVRLSTQALLSVYGQSSVPVSEL